MNIFGRSNTGLTRGCFVKFELDTAGSKGASLTICSSDGKDVILPNTENPYLPVVLTGVDISQQESVGRLKCFRSRVYTYAFGADVGNVTVSFAVFLASGKVNKPNVAGSKPATVQASDVVATMLNLYKSGRVSQSKRSAVLSMGTDGSSIKGQIDTFKSGTQDLEHNIQSIQMGMTTIPDPDQDKNQ